MRKSGLASVLIAMAIVHCMGISKCAAKIDSQEVLRRLRVKKLAIVGKIIISTPAKKCIPKMVNALCNARHRLKDSRCACGACAKKKREVKRKWIQWIAKAAGPSSRAKKAQKNVILRRCASRSLNKAKELVKSARLICPRICLI